LKIVETEAKSIPQTHIYMTAQFSELDTGIPIKSG